MRQQTEREVCVCVLSFVDAPPAQKPQLLHLTLLGCVWEK